MLPGLHCASPVAYLFATRGVGAERPGGIRCTASGVYAPRPIRSVTVRAVLSYQLVVNWSEVFLVYVRYLPSLMDRLTDNEPAKRLEAQRPQAMSFQEYRAGFQRDLMRLLSYGLQAASDEFVGYPEVQRSVLNYGMANLLGMADMAANPSVVEQNIVEAIRRFEPRVNRDTLRVNVSRNEVPGENIMKNLEIEIQAELWAKPYSEHVYLLTSVDLHNASVKVKEWRNG